MPTPTSKTGAAVSEADGSSLTSSAAAAMPVNASSRSSTLKRGGVTGEGGVHQSRAAYGGGTRGRPLAFFPCLRRSVARFPKPSVRCRLHRTKWECARVCRVGAAVLRLAFDVLSIFFHFFAASNRSSVNLHILSSSFQYFFLFIPTKMRARTGKHGVSSDVKENAVFNQ